MLTVGISDAKYAKGNESLVTYALGSCVGICIYDSLLKTGGMGHIMLPSSAEFADKSNINKFADSCVKDMVRQLTIMGCNKTRLVARIAGGAQMFATTTDSSIGNIGQRNVTAVKQALMAERIPIKGEDVGLNYGRTLYFHIETGIAEVKAFNHPIKKL